MKTLPFICLASALVVAGSSNAQNIVQNPGFETGDFTDWSESSTAIVSNPVNVHSGNYATELADATSSVSQTLTTVPGDTYDLTFWLQFVGGGIHSPKPFSVSWDGSTVFSITSSGLFLYEEETIDGLTASSASTILTLNSGNGLGEYFLDDISVVDVSAAAGVPDGGATSALLGFGFAVLAFIKYRKS